MAFLNYREESKKSYGITVGPLESSALNQEQLQTGALLRIADATEIMAKDRVRMERDLNWYKKKYTEHVEEIAKLTKSNSALKGHFKRLKNKAS